MSVQERILEIEMLNVRYGPIHALRDVSLYVGKGEIVTIVGANGAGKSTLLRTISGLVRPSSGTIVFDGEDITSEPPHAIVRRGLCHAPEGRRIFANMTVRENLLLGAYVHSNPDTLIQDFERVFTIFPRLKEREHQIAGTLSGGEQQMLAIGRALMSRPKMLMLDEPSLGLAPNLVQEIFRTIESINREGTTVLLVEQNAHMALHIAHRGYVLETGEVVLADYAENLLRNEAVRSAYLGE
ncbi:High-affinity branched-chain amino acid transport ATP-binding protein LivF [bacterium HR16]|nr:High-affinity branched-chain amino acid transport ATP-binding protein LivF [bacterium HR16]